VQPEALRHDPRKLGKRELSALDAGTRTAIGATGRVTAPGSRTEGSGMSEGTITNRHTTDWPMEHGIAQVDMDVLLDSWDRRTGPENIRRSWQQEGIDNVLDVAWLREHVAEFDDDALISLFVDLASFSGGADMNAQIEIVMTARPDGWWMS
jgi:hypothetical protein